MRSADFKRRLVCLRPDTLMVEPWQPYTSSEEFACTGLTGPDPTDLTVLFPTGHTDLTVPTGHMDLTREIIGRTETRLRLAPNDKLQMTDDKGPIFHLSSCHLSLGPTLR